MDEVLRNVVKPMVCFIRTHDRAYALPDYIQAPSIYTLIPDITIQKVVDMCNNRWCGTAIEGELEAAGIYYLLTRLGVAYKTLSPCYWVSNMVQNTSHVIIRVPTTDYRVVVYVADGIFDSREVYLNFDSVAEAETVVHMLTARVAIQVSYNCPFYATLYKVFSNISGYVIRGSCIRPVIVYKNIRYVVDHDDYSLQRVMYIQTTREGDDGLIPTECQYLNQNIVDAGVVVVRATNVVPQSVAAELIGVFNGTLLNCGHATMDLAEKIGYSHPALISHRFVSYLHQTPGFTVTLDLTSYALIKATGVKGAKFWNRIVQGERNVLNTMEPCGFTVTATDWCRLVGGAQKVENIETQLGEAHASSAMTSIPISTSTPAAKAEIVQTSPAAKAAPVQTSAAKAASVQTARLMSITGIAADAVNIELDEKFLRKNPDANLVGGAVYKTKLSAQQLSDMIEALDGTNEIERGDYIDIHCEATRMKLASVLKHIYYGADIRNGNERVRVLIDNRFNTRFPNAFLPERYECNLTLRQLQSIGAILDYGEVRVVLSLDDWKAVHEALRVLGVASAVSNVIIEDDYVNRVQMALEHIALLIDRHGGEFGEVVEEQIFALINAVEWSRATNGQRESLAKMLAVVSKKYAFVAKLAVVNA